MKIEIVGVGNTLFGDDRIGVKVVEGLGIVAESAPENFITALEGDAVIFVDAIDMGLKPGSVVVLKNPPPEIATSTHKIPYAVFQKYLEEKGKKIILIGIQIQSTKQLTQEVRKAGEKVRKVLIQVKEGVFEDVQTLYQTILRLLSEASLSVVSDM